MGCYGNGLKIPVGEALSSGLNTVDYSGCGAVNYREY